MTNTERYYEVLGLKPGASPEEIKQAYRDLANVWHPDRFSHNPRLQRKAEEKLKDINVAYDRLRAEAQARRPTSAQRAGETRGGESGASYHPGAERRQAGAAEAAGRPREPAGETPADRPPVYARRVPEWVSHKIAVLACGAVALYLLLVWLPRLVHTNRPSGGAGARAPGPSARSPTGGQDALFVRRLGPDERVALNDEVRWPRDAKLAPSDRHPATRSEIVLLSAKRWTVSRIAKHLGIDEGAVRRTIQAFNARGLAMLEPLDAEERASREFDKLIRSFAARIDDSADRAEFESAAHEAKRRVLSLSTHELHERTVSYLKEKYGQTQWLSERTEKETKLLQTASGTEADKIARTLRGSVFMVELRHLADKHRAPEERLIR